MDNSRVVQIRKKGGLQNIVRDTGGGKLVPLLYNTKDKRSEGSLEGSYKGRTILDTKHFIAPIWSDIHRRWSFQGSSEKLSELIDKMKLRYPKKHERAGQIIKPSENDGDRLTNRQDEVFNHPDLYGKYFMENGRISLNLSDPKQDFLFHCYKGDTSVTDKSNESDLNKFISSTASYEIVSPKAETRTKKEVADKDIKGIMLLANMNNDEQKLRAICSIMGLPQYSSTTDVSAMFVLLKETAVENKVFSNRYDKTYQDRFIELAEMEDEKLLILYQITQAKNKGIIRKRSDHYLLNGEKLEGVNTETRLFSFLKEPRNQEYYLKLVNLLEE